jgi:hypothetical protein
MTTRNAMPDRVPDAATGITIVSAIAANYAADPLGTIAAVLALVAGAVSVISGIIRIVKDLRK